MVKIFELKNDKKAFWRILEAFIAVMIIASVLSFIYIRQTKKTSLDDEAQKLISLMLDEISSNSTLRQAVLDDNEVSRQKVNNALAKLTPEGFSSTFQICGIDDICGITTSFTSNEVYSDEASISVTLDSSGFVPKKIRIFLWEK